MQIEEVITAVRSPWQNAYAQAPDRQRPAGVSRPRQRAVVESELFNLPIDQPAAQFDVSRVCELVHYPSDIHTDGTFVTHRSITIVAITIESTAAFTNIRLYFKVLITFS
jgi:hypothetical protein